MATDDTPATQQEIADAGAILRAAGWAAQGTHVWTCPADGGRIAFTDGDLIAAAAELALAPDLTAAELRGLIDLPPAPPSEPAARPARPPWPALQGEAFFGLLQSGAGALAHIWEPVKRWPGRWTSPCGISVQPLQPAIVAPNAQGVALCAQCRARYAPAPAPAAPEAPLVTVDELDAMAAAASGVTVVMTADEARAATAEIRTSIGDLRGKIADFDTREGWRALGYPSFRAWALQEIDEASLRHIYRLRDAADVDRSLGVTIGHTPESHARELSRVDPTDRQAVLERAAELAGGAPVGARHIAAARSPEPQPPAPAVAGDLQPEPGLVARCAALGLQLRPPTDGDGYELHGLPSGVAVFGGRRALVDWLDAQERAGARDRRAPEPEALSTCATCKAAPAAFGTLCGPCFRGETPEAQAAAARVLAPVEPAAPTPAERTATAVDRAIEENRNNPAWRAGATAGEALIWEVAGLLGSDEADALPRALHAARQLVALLEIDAGGPVELQTAAVYRRVIELERTPAPWGLVALRDADDVAGALEDLAGLLDDRAYEDLARRLRVARTRAKAAA